MCKPRPVWLRSKPDVSCEAQADLPLASLDGRSWPEASAPTAEKRVAN